jgi:hypothetical protein
MASSTVPTTVPSFGRGSPVHTYWLERCDGFEAIRADGRSMGRVRRFESPDGGAFLRLGGLRSRTVPVSAVDMVWPALSLLLVADSDAATDSNTATEKQARTSDLALSDPGPQEGAPQSATSFGPAARRAGDRQLAGKTSRPRWEDETLPWWELLPENGEADGAPKPLRGHFSLERRWTAAQRYVFSGRDAARKVAVWISDRSQKLAALSFRQAGKGRHLMCVRLRAVGDRCDTAYAFAADLIARERLTLGRLLLRFAVWVGGDGGRLEPPTSRRGETTTRR